MKHPGQQHNHLFTILPKPPVRIGTGLPCASCTAECCAAVPASLDEVNKIVRFLNRNEGLAARLAAQTRLAPKCPFVDMTTFRCAVYEARPLVCRLYGYSPRLTCSYAPELAREVQGDLEAGAGLYDQPETHLVVLGVNLTWTELAGDQEKSSVLPLTEQEE